MVSMAGILVKTVGEEIGGEEWTFYYIVSLFMMTHCIDDNRYKVKPERGGFLTINSDH